VSGEREKDGERDERAGDGERAGNEPQHPSGTGADRDEQKVSAPSLGPNTVIEREPVEERLARHDQSEEDAMGRDKRRPVVGQSHGPSVARQLALYGVFLAVLAGLLVGGFILVGSLDKSVGKDVPNSAPWAKPGAKQVQPKPIQ
jgi:predicted MPP superfamily phosphohydrolase